MSLNPADEQTRGARFWRCDLQVHSPLEPEFKPGVSSSDKKAIQGAAEKWVTAALDAGLEVVALTDHNAVHFLDPASTAASGHPLTIFPGVEISSSDGYHVLCLFEPGTPTLRLSEFLARIGIGTGQARHKDGKVRLAHNDFDFARIVEEVHERGGICIAPHVRRDNGLLKSAMAGDIRVRVWKNERLLAVEDDRKELKPGSFADDCMANTRDDYKRSRPPARVWGSDAKSYEAIGSSSTMIKMVAPTIEGLRQAFLDPQSRVRHYDDHVEGSRDRIERIAWDGGFFSGSSVEFSDQLNCVIGGKGSGKSTLLESIRFVFGLEAGGPAAGNYDKLIESTIPPGTKVTIDIELRDGSRYSVSRTPSYKPEVRNSEGVLVDVAPSAIFAVDVYSQGQILETARQPMAHLGLLDSFLQEDLEALERAAADLERKLVDNRRAYVKAIEDKDRISENLAAIRRLQEIRKTFEKKGVAARTEVRRQLDREERLLTEARAFVNNQGEPIHSLDRLQQPPTLFIDESLPHANTWKSIATTWTKLGELTGRFMADAEKALAEVGSALDEATKPGSPWDISVREKREDVARVYRELQETYPDLDLSQFDRIDRQLEELLASGDDQAAATAEVAQVQTTRNDLLSKIRDNRRKQFRARDELAKQLTSQLGGAIKIDVDFQGQRGVLLEKLTGFKTKVRSEALKALADETATTPEALGASLVEGAGATVKTFTALSESQASALCERLSLDQKLALQEFRVPDAVSIEFNLADEGETPRYRDLARLSVGQKATSILLILLAQRQKPLLIDQPEDDLDNRFIFKDVVQRLRGAKNDRQLILATHNANIPVLGDAELIVVLDAEEDAGRPVGRIVDCGSIDSPTMKRHVTQILEGGLEAFRLREAKYGEPPGGTVSSV